LKKIKLKIPSKEYTVFLGEGNFLDLPNIMNKEKVYGDLLLIIDSNVHRYYSTIIEQTFSDTQTIVKKIIIHSSEKNKSYVTLQKIHSVLVKNNYETILVLVAIGGGIIGDIAGFAASTYMRGIKYVQVPTTLLASVDSSVGGKTGINFENTKNIIGSFYQPELVLIDTRFFGTLPNEEQLCGTWGKVNWWIENRIKITVKNRFIIKNVRLLLKLIRWLFF